MPHTLLGSRSHVTIFRRILETTNKQRLVPEHAIDTENNRLSDASQ